MSIGRQFKEASRLAGESKIMSLQVEDQQEKLAEAEQAMAASNQELDQLSEELATVKEELAQLEKKEGWLALVSMVALLVVMNADEGHIQALSQAISSLSSLSETFGDHVWDDLVSSWKQLYSLLMDSLCSKHGMERKLWATESNKVCNMILLY